MANKSAVTEQLPAPTVAVPIGVDPEEARTLAASATTLEELKAIVQSYDGCGLKIRATQLCFADGNPDANIMLIGEAPGADDDREGVPFAGKIGHLLDAMLAGIGLDRSKVYIANTVPWRPPGNRQPTPEEMALCLPFLLKQVELVSPKIIVTLGTPAMHTVFNTRQSIIRMRGKWSELKFGSQPAQAMPTLHPADVLRTPSAKQQVWQDILSLKLKADELGLGS
jgi:uracil-DNA glycosylase family 4